MIAADSWKAFFTDGWNIFDLSLVLIGYIPKAIVANVSAMMALRVLRVFRVLHLLRAAKEIKIMIIVLIKSMSALFYNIVLFVIFIYLFAIVGVSLFRLSEPETLTPEQLVEYQVYIQEAPNSPTNSEDSYGTLGE